MKRAKRSLSSTQRREDEADVGFGGPKANRPRGLSLRLDLFGDLRLRRLSLPNARHRHLPRKGSWSQDSSVGGRRRRLGQIRIRIIKQKRELGDHPRDLLPDLACEDAQPLFLGIERHIARTPFEVGEPFFEPTQQVFALPHLSVNAVQIRRSRAHGRTSEGGWERYPDFGASRKETGSFAGGTPSRLLKPREASIL